MATASIRALMDDLVDYAGLFPPAGLDMGAAVANYARYREGEDRWMLGRFVVTAARLGEFSAAARTLATAASPWPLSILLGDDVAGDLRSVDAFSAENDAVRIDSIEVRASGKNTAARLVDVIPPTLHAFVEIPAAGDVREWARSLSEGRLRAKIRTGGVAADMIPPVDAVARFVRACYGQGVAFKATAGLHHALRAERALTYEENAPRSTMHGFLNVFLTALFCYNGLGSADAPRLLSVTDAAEVTFDDDAVSWDQYRLSTAEIVTARRRFATSFGSCSFEEPVADLRALNLL